MDELVSRPTIPAGEKKHLGIKEATKRKGEAQHIEMCAKSTQQIAKTYQKVSRFESGAIHMVDAIFFEHPGEAIDQPVFI